jgi:hypothetical protein
MERLLLRDDQWANWSRGTQFVYPLALAACGREECLTRVVRRASQGLALTPLSQDDRYMIPLLTDYLFTWNAWTKRTEDPMG